MTLTADILQELRDHPETISPLQAGPRTKFRDLAIGDMFDFVNDEYPLLNSFSLRCVKFTDSRYQDSNGVIHRTGDPSAYVYHVTMHR